MTSAPERPTRPLTRRQHEVLDFIQQYLSFHGYPPTLADIGAHLGINSMATVHEHLTELETRGYIARGRGARQISVLSQAADLERYLIASHVSIPSEVALQRAQRAVIQAESFPQANAALLMTEIIHTARPSSVIIYEYSDPDDLIIPLSWQGPWQSRETPPSYQRGQGIPGFVFETGDGYVSEGNVQNDPQYSHQGDPYFARDRSVLAIPIIDRDRSTIGVTNLTSRVKNWFPFELAAELQQVVKDCSRQFEGHSLAELTAADPVAVNLWLIQNSLSRHMA
ncbi:MAG: hypothetical protein HYS86_05365 [Candidatus Chisholmbacteria bacterium]|nr:hypothetical protein [Candidatus Chisholmbacteria bacterium]